MDWDDDDIEHSGSSGEYYEENLDGFQIDGVDDQAGDAADDWLNMVDPAMDVDQEPADDWLNMVDPAMDVDQEPAESMNEAYMGASTNVLQEGRIGKLSAPVVAAVKHLAEGGQIDGIDSLDAAVAVEGFESAIDGSASMFASNSIKGDVVSPTTHTIYADDGSVSSRNVIHNPLGLPNSKKDKRIALSILDSVKEYETLGPGSGLAGHTLNDRKHYKQEEELLKSFENAEKLAELYISNKTPKDSHIYGARKNALVHGIFERALAGSQSKRDDGTYAQNIMALPNETGLTGIKPTRAYRGGVVGTPFTRLEFDIYAEKNNLTPSDDEYWKLRGSLSDSLFPRAWKKGFSEEDKAKAKRDQTYQMGKALDMAGQIRDTMVKQMPTNRDESAGQGRIYGHDHPYGDQLERANALNEAFIMDVDGSKEVGLTNEHVTDLSQMAGKSMMTQTPSEDDLDKGIRKYTGLSAQGSSSSYVSPNAYGTGVDTDIDEFIQDATTKAPVMLSNTAILESDSYRAGVARAIEGQFGIDGIAAEDMVGPIRPEIEGIEQRTDEWYAARKGLVTASKLTNASGRLLTEGEIAAQLARERLGKAEEVVGNAHTKEGVEGEAKALRAFLRLQKNRGIEMEHTEVGLLQNPDLPGLGASPDGRLTLKSTGKNAGLLELKYLSSSMMESAIKKYTPQMQLQMAVTGESQTHFLALDKETGDTIDAIIHADPKMQADIIRTSTDARKLAAGLTIREVQTLERVTAEERRNGKGQDKSFDVPSDNIDKPMATYTGVSVDPTKANETLAAYVAKSKASTMADVETEAHEANDKVDRDIRSMAKLEAAAYNEARSRGKVENAAHKENAKRGYDMGKAEHEAYIENTKRASKAVEELSESAAKAAKGFIAVASEIGGVLREGADSAMDTMRFAGSVGMDENDVRGMEFELTTGEGGLDKGSARSNIRALATSRDNLLHKTRAGAELTSMQVDYHDWADKDGRSLKDITGRDFHSMDYVGMSVKERYAEALDRAEGQPLLVRQAIGKAMRVPHIGNTRIGGDVIRNARGDIDREGTTEFYTGAERIDQFGQTVLEKAAASTGEEGGQAAAISQWANRAAESKTTAAGLALITGVAGIAKNPLALARAAKVGGGALGRLAPAAVAAEFVYEARGGGPLDQRGKLTSGLAKGMSDGLRNFEMSDLIPKNKWAYTDTRGKESSAPTIVNNNNIKVDVDPSLKVTVKQDEAGEDLLGGNWSAP